MSYCRLNRSLMILWFYTAQVDGIEWFEIVVAEHRFKRPKVLRKKRNCIVWIDPAQTAPFGSVFFPPGIGHTQVRMCLHGTRRETQNDCEACCLHPLCGQYSGHVIPMFDVALGMTFSTVLHCILSRGRGPAPHGRCWNLVIYNCPWLDCTDLFLNIWQVCILSHWMPSICACDSEICRDLLKTFRALYLHMLQSAIRLLWPHLVQHGLRQPTWPCHAIPTGGWNHQPIAATASQPVYSHSCSFWNRFCDE